jgi:hypothetical protein
MAAAVSPRSPSASSSSNEFKSTATSSTSPSNNNVFSVVGHRGTGKSVSLSYACQYAKQNNWLVVPFRAEEWTKDHLGFIKESRDRYGIFNQNAFSSYFLGRLKASETAALRKIKLKLTTYTWDWNKLKKASATTASTEASAGDEAAAGEQDNNDAETASGSQAKTAESATAEVADLDFSNRTLYDLASLAVAYPEKAQEMLYQFVQEIHLATEVPVLVCIDNINEWDQITEFRHPKTLKRLFARNLGGVDAFSFFEKTAPKNGVSVLAVTSSATFKNAKELVSGTQKIFTALTYSDEELKNCMEHYFVSKFLLTSIDDELVLRYRGLSGGVPKDVFTMTKVL